MLFAKKIVHLIKQLFLSQKCSSEKTFQLVSDVNDELPIETSVLPANFSVYVLFLRHTEKIRGKNCSYLSKNVSIFVKLENIYMTKMKFLFVLANSLTNLMYFKKEEKFFATKFIQKSVA